MKGTPGEKEHSDRHMRGHQVTGASRHYRKTVSNTASGHRPVRTSLFGKTKDSSPKQNKSNIAGGLTAIQCKRLTGGLAPLDLDDRDDGVQYLQPKTGNSLEQVTTSNNQFAPSTPVQIPSSSSFLFGTPRTCPAVVEGRQSTRSPSSPGYAGAKFSEAPSPKVLPKPPVHWVDTSLTALVPPSSCKFGGSCREMTDALKGLLKVPC